MSALSLLVVLTLACRNRDADFMEDTAPPPAEPVACDPVESLVDSQNTCVHGATCLEVLSEDPYAVSGEYVLDLDGLDQGVDPMGVYCDMDTDGGGWTVLNEAHLQAGGWLEFEHVAGEGSPRMGWVEGGGFLLAPEGAHGCQTMALRATAWLPMTFSELGGAWTGGGEQEGSQHDDVYGMLRWGEVTDDCRGHLKFGTDQDTLKQGGEWGMHWAPHAPEGKRFAWPDQAVATSSVVRWELMDQGSPEDVVISRITLRLR